jgi:hypothetical protein
VRLHSEMGVRSIHHAIVRHVAVKDKLLTSVRESEDCCTNTDNAIRITSRTPAPSWALEQLTRARIFLSGSRVREGRFVDVTTSDVLNS